MNVGSTFSGVGGFDLGLERAGLRVVWQCEADPYRRAVLRRHWPDVPCYDDIRAVAVSGEHGGRPASVGRERPAAQRGEPQRPVDLLCGGFPCQDLSVAGRRRGLAGDRSGLFFEFARVADLVLSDGGWVLIENVPGLLSSHDGRDFAVLLATLAELGFHDLAWRVLDSRYLGVPQRRRRVFILGRRACGRCASEVLLEPESGGGHPTPGGEAGAGAAGASDGGAVSTLQAAGGHGTSRRSYRIDAEGAAGGHLLAGTVRSHMRPGSNESGGIVANTLKGQAGKGGSGIGPEHNFVCEAADADGVRAPSGLPGRVDDPRPDGPRYAAMGDAVTVNVAEWIGRRLMARAET